MDADLLTKFVPVFHLDKDEAIGPCSFEQYVDGSSLLDTEHGTKLAEPGAWKLADHADNKDVCMNFDRAPWSPEDCKDAPIYAVCSTVREGSKAYYSLLYVCLFPAGQSFQGDADKMGQQWPDLAHIRVYVDHQTLKIAKIYFPGYANSGGWMPSEKATYADVDKKHVRIYVGKGTHTMNPRRGTIWRAGGSKFNDFARGPRRSHYPRFSALCTSLVYHPTSTVGADEHRARQIDDRQKDREGFAATVR
ncbi:MAG: hypothetical protein Q9206_007191 [Seirophora lacunosa]